MEEGIPVSLVGIYKLLRKYSSSPDTQKKHCLVLALTHISTRTHFHSHTFPLTHISTHTHFHSHTFWYLVSRSCSGSIVASPDTHKKHCLVLALTHISTRTHIRSHTFPLAHFHSHSHTFPLALISTHTRRHFHSHLHILPLALVHKF